MSSGLNLINVTNYGATGNGSTDDTASLNAAIADRNANPGKMLYFPAGTYKITSALTAISSSGIIFGDGNVGYAYAEGAGRSSGASVIQLNAGTGVALTISAADALLMGMVIRNRNGTTPTAGAGVAYTYAVAASDPAGKLDLESVTIDGFYDDVDYQGGTFWTMRDCQIGNAVRYGLRIRNVANTDWGMWSLTNNYFWTANDRSYKTAAALRLEGSGGGKIMGCNWVGGTGSAASMDRDIDIVGDGTTSSLTVANCALENWGINAVRSVGAWPGMAFSNLEVSRYSPANTTGSAFSITTNNDVIITNCVLSNGGGTGTAIVLSSVTRGLVTNNTNNGFPTLVTGNDLP